MLSFQAHPLGSYARTIEFRPLSLRKEPYVETYLTKFEYLQISVEIKGPAPLLYLLSHIFPIPAFAIGLGSPRYHPVATATSLEWRRSPVGDDLTEGYF